MDVTLGACGLVLAFLCMLLGMGEVGLWVACYFECPAGQEIEFNYFAAVWTGALAFAVGFLIVVLFCVKFKFLGTFIILLTFLLVPCEIICACIYAYRAFLARPEEGTLTGDISTDYFSVFMFAAMSLVGTVLFVLTVTWNCYYCCIATPQEDYEEEIKEELEEEEARQREIRTAQDRFINNPIVEDDYRMNRPSALAFDEPVESHPLYGDRGNNRYPNSHPPHYTRNGHMASSAVPDNRRQSRYPQAAPIMDDYPYPEALSREPKPAPRKQRQQQQPQPRLLRPNLHPNHQSYIRDDEGRGQVNRAYEPDEYGRPISNGYGLRSYIFDGAQGNSFNGQAEQQRSRYNRDDRPQPEASRRRPNEHEMNDHAGNNRHNESRRHVNRDPNFRGRGLSRATPAPQQAQAGRNGDIVEEDRSYIYRPRPENFRGKPPMPDYMQQQPLQLQATRSQQEQQQQQQYQRQQQDQYAGNLGAANSQYSAFRSSEAVDSYF